MKSRMKTWILKVNTFSRDINKLQIDIVLVQVIMMMQLYGDIQKISTSSVVAYSYT